MEKSKAGRLKAPGLKWIKRKASHTPVWVASAKGYPTPTVNLSAFRDNDAMLRAECVRLQAEMYKWQAGVREHVTGFDGTIGSILDKYRNDADSTYRSLRPTSKKPYAYFLERLKFEIGDRRLDSITGMDLIKWHEAWGEGGERLASSKMMRAVLRAAMAYALMSFKTGSSEWRAVFDLRESLKVASRTLPSPRRREATVTYEQVIALRQSAHAHGRPSMALAYALVFETTLRLWDVIGQWWPVESDFVSEVISRDSAKKWFGIRWDDIDDSLVIRYMPSKTSAKTGLAVTFPLYSAPMVIEELVHWPVGQRSGPIIRAENNGLPYLPNTFRYHWYMDRDAAGIDKGVWPRDLRASGISEARAGGVATDDAAKVAGHASTKTTAAVYDRASLEAGERFAEARNKRRKAGAK